MTNVGFDQRSPFLLRLALVPSLRSLHPYLISSYRIVSYQRLPTSAQSSASPIAYAKLDEPSTCTLKNSCSLRRSAMRTWSRATRLNRSFDEILGQTSYRVADAVGGGVTAIPGLACSGCNLIPLHKLSGVHFSRTSARASDVDMRYEVGAGSLESKTTHSENVCTRICLFA